MTILPAPICVESHISLNKKLTDDAALAQPMSKEYKKCGNKVFPHKIKCDKHNH